MTDPFMRVDVSQASRDFQPVALEPGLPMLDRSNSNGQTLRKWLGALVAEPERVGDRVGFYVRDDESRRIDSVFCVPVSDKDLAGDLSKDFKEMQRRIAAAKPESSNEQLIHRIASEQIKNLADENNARDRRWCLFKFRDGKNKLHLVWAPGYRRRDNEPAAPLVCTNPTCSHLFLQRRDSGAKCPVCQAIRTEAKADKNRVAFAGMLSKLLAFLFFIALGIGGTIWWQRQQAQQDPVNGGQPSANAPLTVEPAEWSGPVGSQVQFTITRHDGEKPEVVTASAAVTVSNPKILSVKPYENVGKALNSGKTELTFFVGALSAQATVTVGPPETPSKLILQPDKLELGIGTTAQLKLIGEYEGGRQADLTEDPNVEWEARHDAKYFVHKGRIEGEEPGTGTLRVRYLAGEAANPPEATAEISVRDLQYKSLKITVDPSMPLLGRPAKLHVVATTESGSDLSVDESKDLTFEVAPAESATARGSVLMPLTEGDAKLTASFRGLTATADLKISKSTDAPQPLDVSPKSLELKLGELAQLSVLSGRPDLVQLKSANPEIVEVTADGRVIGRGIGTSEIEVSDGSQPVKITATVAAAQWKNIELEPRRMKVLADETATIKLFGILDGSERVELAGDQVNWTALPRPEFMEFEKTTLQVKGLKPTGDRPERLTARYKTFDSTIEIEVVAAPLVLTLSPEGSIEIPVGQKQALQVMAQQGGSAATAVAPERIEWVMSSNAGFEVKNGEIHAKAENARIRLSAKYQSATSNELEVSSVAAPPLTLQATADPSSLPVGEAGVVTATATGPGGPVTISEDGLSFSSSDPMVVEVIETTGAFRAKAVGTATIRVSHASSKQPAEVAVTVTEPEPDPSEIFVKPASLRLVANQGDSITLPLGAEFADWKAEAVADDGTVTDVSDKVTLVVEGDATKSTLSNLLEQAAKQLQLDVGGGPKASAAVIREGRIVGASPGKSIVHAVYGGIRTTNGLNVEVTSALEIDEIRIVPSTVNLVVHESAGLQAIGYKSGNSVGEITSRSELVWKSADNGPLQMDGPQITAKAVGSTSVTASLGPVVSKPATVTVVDPEQGGSTPAAVGRLVVTPSRLRMKTGEVARIGQEFTVTRQQTDFSATCEVAPPPNRVVSFDPDSRTLLAVSPGRTRITFIVRDQSATLEIEVDPDVVPAADSSIVVEPSTGRLAVGEQLALRAFIVTANGTRTPVTAALRSSDPTIAAVSGSSIQGMAAGDVTIEARVPGITEPGTAVFAVESVEIQQLAFSPAAMSLAVGQRKTFDVFGVTPSGRRRLGDDPDLDLSVSEADAAIIEVSPESRQILGLRPGTASVIATWKGGLERRLPVTVQIDSITELVIQPDVTTVEEGGIAEFQVLARRSGRLQPLQSIDGVKLSVSDPVVATPNDAELSVTGLKAGRAQVTASYGTRRAVAQLTVIPRRRPVAPPPSPERLRFLAHFRQMDLGYPGDAVRVVRVLSDGTEEDVDHLVTLTVQDPQDIVRIEQTASGPVVKPNKIGQTQIDAALGNLRTERPFLVEVAARIPRQHELRARPASMQIQLGEIAQFLRADILPANGDSPIPVPFTVSATPNRFVEVRADNSIRGLEVGTAVVTLTANDPEGKYTGIATSAAVEVVDPAQPASEGTAPRSQLPPELTLNGPTETSVGAEIQMAVELTQNGQSSDVTNRAQLVLVTGDEALARVLPGGLIQALASGRITVQARLNDLTSAPRQVLIRPIAEFERLELEVARGRMGVGEVRGYQLWGYPRGGGTRQDLTRLVTDDQSSTTLPRMRLQMIEPNAGTQVVAHRPGSFSGLQSGRFSAQALLGDRLSTEVATIEVMGDIPRPERMRVEPDRLELRTADLTPPIRILVASPGDHNFRAIDASLAEVTSSNPEVLQPAEPGIFTAGRPGQAKINVRYQGLEQSIPVTVKYNPFAEIEVGRDPKFVDSTLTVDLTVNANTTAVDLEYRTTLPNSNGRADEETEWVKAGKVGDRLSAQLRSPKIPLVRGQNHYSLVIEAKNTRSGDIERHPFSFRIESTSRGSKPAEPK
jgi:plastocyanin